MSEPYIGEIRLFAGDYAPQGWAICAGQLRAISVEPALFSLLGITYGGDGRTTFGLPDLRGRVPIGADPSGQQGERAGAVGGSESAGLALGQMPRHSHAVTASVTAGLQVSVEHGSQFEPDASSYLAEGFFQAPNKSHLIEAYVPAAGAVATVALGGVGTSDQVTTVAEAGSGQGHENMQPWVALNYIIALTGLYPPRQ